MQRETITITLPVSKSEVVIKKYLIGRERRALTNVYLDGDLKIGADGKVTTINSKITDTAQNLAWETVIVSIAGKSDGIVDAVLDLHAEDYDVLVEKVNEIGGQKKTNTSAQL